VPDIQHPVYQFALLPDVYSVLSVEPARFVEIPEELLQSARQKNQPVLQL